MLMVFPEFVPVQQHVQSAIATEGLNRPSDSNAVTTKDSNTAGAKLLALLARIVPSSCRTHLLSMPGFPPRSQAIEMSSADAAVTMYRRRAKHTRTMRGAA